MNSCRLVHKLWEKVSFRCQKDGWTQGNIISIVREPIQKQAFKLLMEVNTGVSHVENFEGEKLVYLQGSIYALGISLEYNMSEYQGNFTSSNLV